MKINLFVMFFFILFLSNNLFSYNKLNLRIKQHVNFGNIQYTSPISIQVDDTSSNINNLNSSSKSKTLGIFTIQGKPLDYVDIYIPNSKLISSGIKASYIRVINGNKIQLDSRGFAEVFVGMNLELANVLESSQFVGYIPIDVKSNNTGSSINGELKITGNVRLLSTLIVSDTIDFGTLYLNDNKSCKATVTPNQGFFTTCPLATGKTKRAEFMIKNLLSTPVLSFPKEVYLQSNAKEGGKVYVNNFKYYYVNSKENNYTFYIGGTINIPPDAKMADYVGRMKVIIQY